MLLEENSQLCPVLEHRRLTGKMPPVLQVCSKKLKTLPLLAALAVVLASQPIFARAALAEPVIFNYSNIVRAGGVVNIQGHDFGEHPTAYCTVNGGKPRQVNVVNSGHNVVHIVMPPEVGLYSVQVKNKGNPSKAVFINRARPMHFDTTEIGPGSTFRVFGRNLFEPGYVPVVRLAPVSGSAMSLHPLLHQAKIEAGAAYNTLSVSVPSNIAAGKYTVWVSNGLGAWSQSKMPCPGAIVVRAPGPDTFGLGVPWAQNLDFGKNSYNVLSDPRLSLHAVGDGRNNDQKAIQQAIDTAAAAGGGIVHLPAGTYKLQTESGPLIDFCKNVVIRGAGQDKTKIVYGFGKPGPNFFLASFFKASRAGLCDLTIQNLNENDAWLNSPTIDTLGGKVRQLFLSRVTANIGSGGRINLQGDEILVDHCQLSSIYSLLFMGNCTNSRVSCNSLTQKLGVNLDLTGSNNCVVETNYFRLDANQGKLVTGNVRHGMAIGFARNLVIANNRWETVNGNPASNNDGEAILSEGGGGVRTGEETGTIADAAAGATKLSKNGSYIAGTIVAIIKGTGAGQWRKILSRDGTKILYDRPWAVAPDTRSNYSIFKWSSQNTTITGNSIEGWPRGIWIYQGSTTDTQIDHNYIYNMDGIFIEPCQNITSGNGQFNPVWNTLVNDNHLSSGVTATEINMTADLQQTSNLIGTMALNDQFCNNEIEGNGAKRFENDPAQTEGMCNYLRVEVPSYNDEGVPALSGTIFDRNKLSGCGVQDYLINGGSYCTTVVGNPDDKRKIEIVNDTSDYWNTKGTHTSVRTTLIGLFRKISTRR